MSIQINELRILPFQAKLKDPLSAGIGITSNMES
jgi:hypothetical protein